MIIRPLIALVAKDLRVFFGERHSLILSFAAPIALASFMAAIFGGAGRSEASKIPIVVVDEDRGAISSAIVDGARAEARLDAPSAGLADALARVRGGAAVVAVVIPEGFGEAASEAFLGGGEPPELLFHHDPTHRSDVSLAQGLLTRVVLEAVSAGSFGGDGGGLLDGPLTPGAGLEGKLDDRAIPAGFVAAPPSAGLRMPYTGRELSITSGGADGERGALAAHAFAGMVVQFVLFSAVEWGVGLLVERQRGLWKRLRVAPVSRNTLIASKVAGCLISSLLIVSAVLGFGALAFRFPVRGEFVALVLMATAFAWMAANFGLMVAAFGRSPQGARSVAVLAVLVMVMLGGGWIPGFLFPDWLQRLTPAIPARWAIDGFDAVLSKGFTLAEASPGLLALAGFGAGFGALALVAFRWSEPG